MKKKVICLSIIAGLLLSTGLGLSKGTININKDNKQNVKSSTLLILSEQTIISPRSAKVVSLNI